jgi:hypothetical protein
MMLEAENPQSQLAADLAMKAIGPSAWRFLPMTLAIVAGWSYLFVWVLGSTELLSEIADTQPFEWFVGLIVVFALFGLPGAGMLWGAWLWFRVRYRLATLLSGICLLPVVFTIVLVMLFA